MKETMNKHFDMPKTERKNPLTEDIDTWPLQKILEVMNSEDHKVAPAVAREIPNILKAVKHVVDALSKGGRLFYVGSGTSGRIAVLDASEIQPTFGLSDRVIAIISGGREAVFQAVEGAEDDEEKGKEMLLSYSPDPKDVVVGIASSGRTPFVAGALRAAKSMGIPVVAVVGDPTGQVAQVADVVIAPDVGPEVIAGSTRLKNGTAQKLVLNMISTASMIALGRTYSNLMAGTYPGNKKLSDRSRRILIEATGKNPEDVDRALAESGGDLPLALLMLVSGCSLEKARSALEESKGSIRKAVEVVTGRKEGKPPRPDGAERFSVAPELALGSPEEAGFDPVRLERAFDLVKEAVGDGEGDIPAAVAAVVRNGVVVAPRAYGLAVRTPQRIAATPNTIFDMASLTKVMATTPSILILCERGKLRLDDSVSLFIPEFANGGKESITIRHLLTHTSGLPAHIKFWEMGLRGTDIIKFIAGMELDKESRPGQKVVYSDLGFILLGEVIYRITGLGLKEFAEKEIFKPLGMTHTCFLPPESWKHKIAATEFREDLGKVMWGEVHDENAYALGGIAGHAGLFSTVLDVARYALMWLGGGEYRGVRILSEAAVQTATSEHANSGERRGLGWLLKSSTFSSAGDFLSDRAFGHTGFTGTSLWCDPERNLAIILLTNRVHAGRDSNAVIRLRPRFANAVVSAVRS
ncbi:MAG: N-acetylmuramic acid 6-phosphate etherase [Candidatus Fermentithermobacillus carboniphilus]|uniref:N-acetylmuramic acid 6-phosphate etherase n=1 Tax=Candidatus Fermentithermobacillus carboniphilus TaxID=3085328 RepID=A0AAT9LE60_9FIRM|nr:MAG: N-acetylmuramic acid 6-phosphate etherase [Candidatus Fermentithermobacillus carboniphilus]